MAKEEENQRDRHVLAENFKSYHFKQVFYIESSYCNLAEMH
jgi:hypothetical protein